MDTVTWTVCELSSYCPLCVSWNNKDCDQKKRKEEKSVKKEKILGCKVIHCDYLLFICTWFERDVELVDISKNDTSIWLK